MEKKKGSAVYLSSEEKLYIESLINICGLQAQDALKENNIKVDIDKLYNKLY